MPRPTAAPAAPLFAASLLAASLLTAAGCTDDRPTVEDRIAELGGYGAEDLARGAVTQYLAIDGADIAAGAALPDREAGPGEGRPPLSPALIAADAADKARRFNPGRTAAEIYAEMAPFLDADPRLTDPQRAELKAALEEGMRRPPGGS